METLDTCPRIELLPAQEHNDTGHRHLEVVRRRTARGALLPGIVCHNFACVGGAPSDVTAMTMAMRHCHSENVQCMFIDTDHTHINIDINLNINIYK